MTDLSAAMDKATQVLEKLRGLDDKVGGDAKLQTQIQDATTALGTLELDDIEADQAQIDQLNQQLDTVDQSVSDALKGLAEIGTVISDVAGALEILDKIAGIV